MDCVILGKPSFDRGCTTPAYTKFNSSIRVERLIFRLKCEGAREGIPFKACGISFFKKGQ